MAESSETQDTVPQAAPEEVLDDKSDTPKPTETQNEDDNIEKPTPASTAATMSSAEPSVVAALAADDSEISDKEQPQQPPQPPSLEAELDEMRNTLNDVGKNLSSFWGSVRSQGTKAFQTSRKGLETYAENARLKEYMGKARTELDRLGEQAKASLAAVQDPSLHQQQDSSTSTATVEASTSSSSSTSNNNTRARAPSSSFYGEVYTAPESASTSNTPPPQSTSNSQSFDEREKFHFPDASAFFSRFQTQLNNIPTNWKPNLQQLQTQLNRFEDRAEDYYHKSEAYLKGAGDLLRDAVRVVPPEAGGSDNNSIRSQSTPNPGNATPSKLPTGRRDVLLRRLRVDAADVLLIDPAEQPVVAEDAEQAEQESRARKETRAAFDAFKDKVAGEGGISGELWADKIQSETKSTTTANSSKEENEEESKNDTSDGGISELIAAREKLVPETLPAEEFWLRYFFRKHQVDQEEERRKQLLQEASRQAANADDDDDFNWDMGEDEEVEEGSHEKSGKNVGKKTENEEKQEGTEQHINTANTAPADDSKLTSPRISSEGSSYDMMSTSAGQSEGGQGQSSSNSKDHVAEKGKEHKESEEDSDWE